MSDAIRSAAAVVIVVDIVVVGGPSPLPRFAFAGPYTQGGRGQSHVTVTGHLWPHWWNERRMKRSVYYVIELPCKINAHACMRGMFSDSFVFFPFLRTITCFCSGCTDTVFVRRLRCARVVRVFRAV